MIHHHQANIIGEVGLQPVEQICAALRCARQIDGDDLGATQGRDMAQDIGQRWIGLVGNQYFLAGLERCRHGRCLQARGGIGYQPDLMRFGVEKRGKRRTGCALEFRPAIPDEAIGIAVDLKPPSILCCLQRLRHRAI